MKSNKKILFAIVSAFFLVLGAGLFVRRGGFPLAEEENVISCADIVFGEEKTTGGRLLTKTDATSNNIGISSVSSNYVYSDGVGHSAKFGSRNAKGSLSLSFSSPLRLKRVKMVAYRYEPESQTHLSFSTDAMKEALISPIDKGYPFDDLDNAPDNECVIFRLDHSTVVSSLTIENVSPGKRFFLSKIVLTLFGVNENSSSSESELSSSSDTPIEPVLYIEKNNKEWPTDNKTYRVKPRKTTGNEATVYDVAYNADIGSYLATPTNITIKKTDECLTYERVALYYQAFRQFPPNYKTTKNFTGPNDRLVQTFRKGSYHQNDYTVTLGTFNDESSGIYYEFDISLGNYSAKNRGAGRLVVVEGGITDYESEPVCYFTKDHYADFVEFYNYASGWGKEFKGVQNGSGQYLNIPEVEDPRSLPLTVNPVYVSL